MRNQNEINIIKSQNQNNKAIANIIKADMTTETK